VSISVFFGQNWNRLKRWGEYPRQLGCHGDIGVLGRQAPWQVSARSLQAAYSGARLSIRTMYRGVRAHLLVWGIEWLPCSTASA
jgi:hypothetical protein